MSRAPFSRIDSISYLFFTFIKFQCIGYNITTRGKDMKFYKCKHCGKIIAIVNDKKVPTFCCGEPMSELVPNTEDGAHEKHIPVFKVEGNVVHVTVGEVLHPMLDAHYIEWIAIETNFGNQRKVLKPGDEPKADFALLPGEKVVRVVEHCNLHGLYSTK